MICKLGIFTRTAKISSQQTQKYITKLDTDQIRMEILGSVNFSPQLAEVVSLL